MNLIVGEALNRRADLQKRVAQLQDRLSVGARRGFGGPQDATVDASSRSPSETDATASSASLVERYFTIVKISETGVER